VIVFVMALARGTFSGRVASECRFQTCRRCLKNNRPYRVEHRDVTRKLTGRETLSAPLAGLQRGWFDLV
jgi:hypothetical protein